METNRTRRFVDNKSGRECDTLRVTEIGSDFVSYCFFDGPKIVTPLRPKTDRFNIVHVMRHTLYMHDLHAFFTSCPYRDQTSKQLQSFCRCNSQRRILKYFLRGNGSDAVVVVFDLTGYSNETMSYRLVIRTVTVTGRK